MKIDGQEWVLVPAEPTDAMTEAWWNVSELGPHAEWAAFLAAAPAAPQPKAEGWVSVSERLPNSERDVLAVINASDFTYQSVLSYDGRDWYTESGAAVECGHPERVTHWRELDNTPPATEGAE
jgi:hypothetical protein